MSVFTSILFPFAATFSKPAMCTLAMSLTSTKPLS